MAHGVAGGTGAQEGLVVVAGQPAYVSYDAFSYCDIQNAPSQLLRNILKYSCDIQNPPC